MHSIEREKGMMLQWAARNEESGRPLFDFRNQQLKSYFTEFDNKDNIMEYGFSQIPELKSKLQDLWQKDDVLQEMILPCTTSAFKEKPRDEDASMGDEMRDGTQKEIEIPDFVYVF